MEYLVIDNLLRLRIVVWICDTFNKNFQINICFRKYLKENCREFSDKHFSIKFFLRYSFAPKISLKLSG